MDKTFVVFKNTHHIFGFDARYTMMVLKLVLGRSEDMAHNRKSQLDCEDGKMMKLICEMTILIPKEKLSLWDQKLLQCKGLYLIEDRL
jgi:hypothetical protein